MRFAAVLVLLLGLSCPTFAAEPLTTIVITAPADLPDPNFKGSTVLVMNNIGPAPAGVILNRPTRLPVSHLFPDLKRLAQLDDKLYFGGPVDLESVSFVFRADAPPEHATRILDGVYVSKNRAMLLKLLDREKPTEGLRIFVGYSGWAPGQLEAEIARGAWKLSPADTSAIFGHNAEHPWPESDTPSTGQRI